MSSQDRTPADKCYVENPRTPPQNHLFGTNRPATVELAEIEHPSQDAEVQIFNKPLTDALLLLRFLIAG